MFVIIEFLNFQPRFFIRRDFYTSSLCTNFCIFDKETLQIVELSKIPTHSVRATFESFEIPNYYSIYGKTPLEFLKACYKERLEAVPKIKSEKEIRNYAKAKKEKSSPFVEGGLFEDLGENRKNAQKTDFNSADYDIF